MAASGLEAVSSLTDRLLALCSPWCRRRIATPRPSNELRDPLLVQVMSDDHEVTRGSLHSLMPRDIVMRRFVHWKISWAIHRNSCIWRILIFICFIKRVFNHHVRSILVGRNMHFSTCYHCFISDSLDEYTTPNNLSKLFRDQSWNRNILVQMIYQRIRTPNHLLLHLWIDIIHTFQPFPY